MMTKIGSEFERCSICNHESTYVHTEIMNGVIIHICHTCLEAAEQHYFWLCMGCGEIHLKPKHKVIEQLMDSEIKNTYILSDDIQIIQGTEVCMACIFEGAMYYMDKQQMASC